MPMTAVATEWGSTAPERAMPLPCDRPASRAPRPAAPPRRGRGRAGRDVFRWLCQLRAAPYSYDLIDNLGRRSPPRLTPGLDAARARASAS